LFSRRSLGKPTFTTLRSVILEAIPGEIISRYTGIVDTVESDSFLAELLDPVGDDQRVARIKLDRVPAEDRQHLEPGASFTWTFFSKEHLGAKDQTSRLRFRPSAPLNTEQLFRDTKSLASLIDADDGSAGRQ
jgi:hypothetical protein